MSAGTSSGSSHDARPAPCRALVGGVSRVTAKAPPEQLMTVRQIAEERGLPLVTAESLARVIAREDGVVRLPGFRRVFFRRADVDRRFQDGGIR